MSAFHRFGQVRRGLVATVITCLLALHALPILSPGPCAAGQQHRCACGSDEHDPSECCCGGDPQEASAREQIKALECGLSTDSPFSFDRSGPMACEAPGADPGELGPVADVSLPDREAQGRSPSPLLPPPKPV